MKAFCVDDEFWVLKSLVEAVEQSTDIESAHGFDNADDALSWAGENRVDAAFLDIQLQDGSGLELARWLTELNPEVYIIFCTGYREYVLDAYKIHASGYLTKPVTAPGIKVSHMAFKFRVRDVCKVTYNDVGIGQRGLHIYLFYISGNRMYCVRIGIFPVFHINHPFCRFASAQIV